ncbi:PAS domain S-box protein|uniref:PAS domain S-box-containing protein n=1 Tax=Dendrosporobacter quercicolus TaxID=146817 RepID=A0A1G9QUH4_9FIRM|nr:PAS domain S-box protein [Dendrosporobacter quercicolus]NSL48368.1 PAS domain S-box protein [Dendrosporobacter quercicolus DSM 1736]SDM14654.1 PAS domain S-box-containing protein [Dendrosporobacter quercicolus]
MCGQTKREQEENYRILTENMEDVIWRFDVATMTLMYVSPSIERLRGYTPEEVTGKPLEELVTPSSCRELLEKLPGRLALLESNCYQGELTFLGIVEQPHKDGGTIWTELSTRFIRREDGKAEVIGVSRDCSVRKVQQEELAALYRRLEESEQFLQAMIDAAHCCLACLDREGRLLHVNRQYAKMMGLAPEHMQGRRFADFLPPEVAAKHAVLLDACRRGQTVPFLDVCRPPLTGGTGELNSYYGVYQPFAQANGEVGKMVVALMDITEQKSMERQLAEAERIGRTGSWQYHLPDGRFSCSEGLLALFGLEDRRQPVDYEELLGLLQADDVERLRLMFRQLLKDQTPVRAEARLMLAGGGQRVVQVTGNVLTDCNNQPASIIGTVADINDHKELEALHAGVALRLREFARVMPGLGMIVDQDGLILELFDEHQLLAGKLSERRLNKLGTDRKTGSLLLTIQQAIQKQTLQFGEYTLTTRQGERTFDVRIAPMSCRIGGKFTAACNLTDITDQNRTKKLLQLSYEKRRQRDLLNGLIEQTILPTTQVLDSAWQVRLNLAQPFSCFLLILERWQDADHDYWQAHRQELQFMLERLTDVLQAGSADAVVWESREGVAVLCPAAATEKRTPCREFEIANELNRRLKEQEPSACWRIGIAEFEPDTFNQLARVYAQARNAVQLGRILNPGSAVHHYCDLGVFQFFPAVTNIDEVRNFIHRSLGNLLTYDEVKGTQLLDTLQEILQTDNLNIVAAKFGVHRQTVVFRKQRIETILGFSLDSFETRLTLSMAFKLRQVFGAENDG